MSPKSLLALCDELIHEVLRFSTPADAVVSSFFRQHRMLGMRERQTLAETVYLVLRERLKWQYLAKSGTDGLGRRLALLAWQGSESFLKAAATADEYAWVCKARMMDLSKQPENLRHNLPEWLAVMLKDQVGDEFWPLVQAMAQPAGLDLRVNAIKVKREEAQAALAAEGIATEPVRWSPWGLRTDGKPTLNRTEVFKRGDVEVQDEGSQLLALLTEAKRGEMVVDFCAGAGGKTLALGAMMRNTGRLYAFDVSAHRLAALKPRLARSGLSNVYPAGIAHERDERIKRLAGKMDRVLVDAPCSGLGTLRRNPDLKWRQSAKAIEELTVKQAAILNSAARLVKSGGRLVYATCSLLREENEAIAEAFSAEHPDFELLDAAQVLEHQRVEDAQTLTRDGYLRLWPHIHGTDGFFAAVWQRR